MMYSNFVMIAIVELLPPATSKKARRGRFIDLLLVVVDAFCFAL
jgi:hypothetical protein